MDIVIRPANEGDLPDVLQLIRDLAVYEKEPDAVVVTEEAFLRFFRNKNFESGYTWQCLNIIFFSMLPQGLGQIAANHINGGYAARERMTTPGKEFIITIGSFKETHPNLF